MWRQTVQGPFTNTVRTPTAKDCLGNKGGLVIQNKGGLVIRACIRCLVIDPKGFLGPVLGKMVKKQSRKAWRPLSARALLASRLLHLIPQTVFSCRGSYGVGKGPLKCLAPR